MLLSRTRIVAAAVAGTLLGGTLATVAGSARADSAPGSTIAIVAGDGNYDPIVPGPASASPLYYPTWLASDRAGNVYISFDGGNSDDGNTIAKITKSTGRIGYLLNSAQDNNPPVPGPAVSSPFGDVAAIAAAPDGTVYAADDSNAVIVRITPSGVLSVIAGDGSSGAVTAGPARSSHLDPTALAVGPDGSLFVGDASGVVAKITAGGTLSIVAGNGSFGAPVTGGPATSSPFTQIYGLAVDASGDVFVADSNEHCLTMVSADTADLEPVVGSCGTSGAAVEGPAASSQLYQPQQIALDRFGDLYIVDGNNDKIEKVTDPDSGTGTLSFIAGGNGGLTAGPALTAGALQVSGITVTGSMDVYLAEGSDTLLGKIVADAGSATEPVGLAATGGDTRATLTFLPPIDDGSSAVLRYEYSLDGTTWHTLTTSAATGGRRSGPVTGLTNRHRYTFRVRMVTSFGVGATSGTAQATPQRATPGWFRDPIGRSQRATEVATPLHPERYRGARRHTRARARAFHGQIAVPIPTVKGRSLSARQAAVLSGDGLFEFNSAVLTVSGRSQVRALVPALRGRTLVTCEGYTDYGAEIAWEYKLSRARARTVCAALTKAGVTATKRTAGYGPQHPVVIGGPRSKRSENRRVVVLVNR